MCLFYFDALLLGIEKGLNLVDDGLRLLAVFASPPARLLGVDELAGLLDGHCVRR